MTHRHSGRWPFALLLVGAYLVAHGAMNTLEASPEEAAPEETAPTAAGQDQLELAREAELLRVVTLVENPPYAFVSPLAEGLHGYDVDLAKEIGRHLGLPVEIVPADDAEQIRGILLRGEANLGIATAALPEFTPQMGMTSVPYLIGEQSLLVRAELAADIDDPQALNEPRPDGESYLVGVVRDHVAATAVGERLPEANQRTFGEPADAVRALLNDDVDAFAFDHAWLTSYRQTRDDREATRILSVPLAETPHAMLTRPDQPRLLEKLNRAITDLEHDGTLENLATHYLQSQAWREEYGIPFRDTDETISDRFERLSVIFAIGAVFVLAVVFVLIIVYLHRAHRQQEEKEQAEQQAAT